MTLFGIYVIMLSTPRGGLKRAQSPVSPFFSRVLIGFYVRKMMLVPRAACRPARPRNAYWRGPSRPPVAFVSDRYLSGDTINELPPAVRLMPAAVGGDYESEVTYGNRKPADERGPLE